MALDKKSETAFLALGLVHLYQDNVRPDLDDAVPGNDKFRVSPQKPAQFSWPGDNEGQHGSGLTVDFQIADAAQGAAGTDVDDFLLL